VRSLRRPPNEKPANPKLRPVTLTELHGELDDRAGSMKVSFSVKSLVLVVLCSLVPSVWSTCRATINFGDVGLNETKSVGARGETHVGHVLVFGDSKDWFVWSDWCLANAYRLTRVCQEYPSYKCASAPHTDLLCVDSNNNPVVVMWMLYGVALYPPYHVKYNTSHHIPDVPAGSLERLGYLLQLTRDLFSQTESRVVFASCAWDAFRFEELNQPLRVDEWLKNASALVTSLNKYRVGSLILRTSQAVKSLPASTTALNEGMLRLAKTLDLPVVDTVACIDGLDDEYRLRDSTHPSSIAAMRISRCVLQTARDELPPPTKDVKYALLRPLASL